MTKMQRATQVLSAIAAGVTEPVRSFPQKFNDWLADVNTTSLRIVATIVAVLGTAIRYWGSSPAHPWEPSIEWLGFLAAMAGIDSAQFYAKRKTHRKFADDEPPAPTNGNGGTTP